MLKHLTMPALTGTMTEGKLARWLKAEGDRIKKGEAVAEIETDKAVMELEAEEDGVIGSILVPEGTDAVPVNQPLATIIPDTQAIEPPPPAIQSTQGPNANSRTTPDVSPAPRGSRQTADRVLASPVAKRLAAEASIDLAQISGSGPNGRIIEADVVRLTSNLQSARLREYDKGPPQKEAPSSLAQVDETSVQLDSLGPYTAVLHSPMRKSVARRLTESTSTIPHFYLTVDCRVDRLLALRERLNQEAAPGCKYSINDFVIRASALALREVPGINARWLDSEARRYENIDIAVAVATPEGLITPVIRQADRKELSAISQEMRDLAQRARRRKLKPAEFEGGSFSISNLGTHGIARFAAIINPPQAAILAVGAAERRTVVESEKVVIATLLTCTLSCDHRLIDGALGAEFLRVFRELMAEPSLAN